MLRKEKIQLRDKLAALQEEIDKMNRDRSLLQGNLGQEIEKLRKKLTEQEFSYEERLRLLKLDHENQMKVQEKLLTERAEE